MDRTYEIKPLWDALWSRRNAIAALTVVGALVGLLLGAVLPPWYRAEAVLMPPSESESGFGLVSLLRGIAVPGITIPTQATPADVFLAVLDSRRLNEDIVKRFDLQKVYKRKRMEDAVRELHRHTKFKLTEAGTIVLSVEDHSARRAAEMANTYVDLLDRFNREVRMTKGHRTRMFIEGRLADTRKELAASEQRLANFQSTHKSVALSPEASSTIETAAQLYAQRTALQVRLGVVRGYSRTSTDEELQIQQQLRELDRQLGALPTTGLEQARLLRDTKTLEQVFILLSAQYEEARIDEVRDVTTVELLDPAVAPERRSRPRRSVLLAIGVLGGFSVGLLDAFLRRRRAPGVAAA